MKWKPINNTPKLILLNCNMLMPFNEERCKYCGRIGCTDRGYTLKVGDPPVTVGEAEWSQQLIDKLTETIEHGKLKDYVRVLNLSDPQCVRKLKKSNNAKAVLAKMQQCNEDCFRNNDPCPFRNERCVCQHNVKLDDSLLVCFPNDVDYFDCEFHEKAFSSCYRRQMDGSCGELDEKLGCGDNDLKVMLSHRFSAAPCRFCEESVCKNADSLHFDGVCTLQGLMAPCEQYASVDADHSYTEGVCTYVSSLDGKDDRKIFNSSDYAFRLSQPQREMLCLACRISHTIAKATGLKCLGVRRASKNPLLNDENPLAENAIQINYLYLTHPEDVAKFNSDLVAQAVFDALHYNCKGIRCEEIEMCNFIK